MNTRPHCCPLLLGAALLSACGADASHPADTAPAAEMLADLSAVRDGQEIVLRGAACGQLVAVSGDRHDSGAPLALAAATSATARWRLKAVDQGAFQVVNVATGKCLDIIGDTRDEQAGMQQSDCGSASTASQAWWFNDFPDATSNLISVRSGLALTNAAATGGQGALDQLHDQGLPAQRWALTAPGAASTAAPAAAAPAAAAPAAPAAGNAAATPGAPDPALGQTIRGFVERLMDVPHPIEGFSGMCGEAGCFAKLTAAQVDEFVAAIAFCAEHFMPSSLSLPERAALIAAEISAESSFKVQTVAQNPGSSDPSVTSVGILQVTPKIWLPIFAQRCDVPGLHHYDGSPWDPATTTAEQMATSIWDNAVVAMWAISGQARSGAANPRAVDFHEAEGGQPKTVWTGQYCWVAGFPAAQHGGDLAGQKDHYRASIRSGVAFLGFSPDIIDRAY